MVPKALTLPPSCFTIWQTLSGAEIAQCDPLTLLSQGKHLVTDQLAVALPFPLQT